MNLCDWQVDLFICLYLFISFQTYFWNWRVTINTELLWCQRQKSHLNQLTIDMKSNTHIKRKCQKIKLLLPFFLLKGNWASAETRLWMFLKWNFPFSPTLSIIYFGKAQVVYFAEQADSEDSQSSFQDLLIVESIQVSYQEMKLKFFKLLSITLCHFNLLELQCCSDSENSHTFPMFCTWKWIQWINWCLTSTQRRNISGGL